MRYEAFNRVLSLFRGGGRAPFNQVEISQHYTVKKLIMVIDSVSCAIRRVSEYWNLVLAGLLRRSKK